MKYDHQIYIDVAIKLHDKLTEMGLDIPLGLIRRVIIYSFGFGMSRKKHVLKDVLKCNEDGWMGTIDLTPKIPHQRKRRMIADWLRVNGIGLSIKTGSDLTKHFRWNWRWSIVEEPGDPAILLPDLLLVIMIINMVPSIMAEMANEVGLSRIGISSFGATNYDAAWMVVELDGDRIRVDI